MKTFETEKHNIPEGATHYRDECNEYEFLWVRFNNNSMFVWDDTYWDEVKDDNFKLSVKPIKTATLENQMNIDNLATQTPEEKEALDTMAGISREHLMKMINQQSEIIKELSKKLNTSELPNDSAWNGEGLPPVGVECNFTPDNTYWGFNYIESFAGEVLHYEGEQFIFMLKHKQYNIKDEMIVVSRTDKGEFSKLETPQQREERGRLEAAYDLYVIAQESLNVIGYESFQQFTNDKVQVKFWLAIVDKTNYRKESE